MTGGPDSKRTILETFPKCYQHDFPQGVTVVIKDAMPLVKYKGGHIKTIQDFMHLHVLKPVRDMLDDPSKNITHYYSLLDRGGNMAKRLFVGKKREKKGVEPMREPTKRPFVLPHDGLLPTEWESLIANREITKREVYHLFYRATMEIYSPPIGKTIVLDGAPDRPLDKLDYDLNKDTAYSKIFFARSLATNPDQPVQMSARETLATPMMSAPTVFRGVCPPEIYTHSIQEADLSAFFHVNRHIRFPGCAPDVVPNQHIMIDSNDIDTLWIALLQARDRIDPVTFTFNSRLWVKLQGQEKTRQTYKKKVEAAAAKGKVHFDVIDGRDVYININKLYIDIDNHPEFRKAQYPQGMVVLLNILGGTDFFGDFSGDQYSLFHNVGWRHFVWDTWLKHSDRFYNMIILFYSGTAISNQPNLLRRPFIDEDALLLFIYQCYAAKYGKQIKDLYGTSRVQTKMIIEYTATFALGTQRNEGEDDDKWNKRYNQALKKRIPPEEVLVRYMRLALLNFTYWLNDYRPGGSAICDPLEEYEGLPYYGFLKDPSDPAGKRVTLSPICSPPKPIPDYYSHLVGKHRRQDKEERKQAALLTKAREDEKKANEARDAERIQRQRVIQQRDAQRAKREKEERERSNIVIPERFKQKGASTLPPLKRERAVGEEPAAVKKMK